SGHYALHAPGTIRLRRVGGGHVWLARLPAYRIWIFLCARFCISGAWRDTIRTKLSDPHRRPGNRSPGSFGGGSRDGMSDGIAIVGLACCYPGANTPDELWENVLAQRRAFRRIPAERLRIEDHFSDDRS